MQSLGNPVSYAAAKQPDLSMIAGRSIRLEHVSVATHGDSLYRAIDGDFDSLWTYLGYGPFRSSDEFKAWLSSKEPSRDPWFYAYVDQATGNALGVGSFMRLDAANGVIEVGHIWFSPQLQKTRAATECIFLMMQYAFEVLGVRRLEWKCDSLNAPSRQAALRYGFSFEGIFRQHFIIKGRNRDTAWFAMMDHEWPAIKTATLRWLDDANFDAQGRQKARLQVR
jgi:RimJ/RimL family protein N-acetyltransferase